MSLNRFSNVMFFLQSINLNIYFTLQIQIFRSSLPITKVDNPCNLIFFFDLQACDRSLVGSVAGKQKMRTATATGYRLQATGCRLPRFCFIFSGLWSFVAFVWGFRSSYLGSFSNVANLTTARLHQVAGEHRTSSVWTNSRRCIYR